jgi:rubrerythrin
MIENVTVRRALEFAMTTERQGAVLYDRLARRHADTPELAELFGVLARDEEIHELQFKALLEDLPEGERGELSADEQEYLRALATAEIFYGNNDALDPADRVSTREDALHRALDLEKATLLYYGAMRDVLGPSEVLDAVIKTEKAHLVQVMKVLFTGGTMRGLLEDA